MGHGGAREDDKSIKISFKSKENQNNAAIKTELKKLNFLHKIVFLHNFAIWLPKEKKWFEEKWTETCWNGFIVLGMLSSKKA